MLPDLPAVKSALRAKVLKFTVQRIPIVEPLLGEVGHMRQHEGRAGQIVRSDASSDEINYPRSEFGIQLSRDEMKRLDLKGLLEKLSGLGEQMAEAQARMMLRTVGESAKQVGNTVSTGGEELTPEHLFEMMAKVEWSFDLETEEPTGMSFVMYPDTAARIIPYHSFQEVLLHTLVDSAELEDEKFEGNVYTLMPCIDWLTRRKGRALVEKLWPSATRVSHLEFQVSKPSRLLTFDDDDGVLRMVQLPTPGSWKALGEEAGELLESALPQPLWREAAFIPFLGLLVPPRFTRSVGKALDWLTCGNVSVRLDVNDSGNSAPESGTKT